MQEALRTGLQAPDWRVLLIGGSSGTGKTVLAHQLARHFGVALTQVDDIRLSLQRLTSPQDQPALHFFRATTNVWQRPADELRDRLIAVAGVVSHALGTVIDHHLSTPHPLILEGDGILPGLAATSSGPGADQRRLVRAVFLMASHEDSILANMTKRGRGFDQDAVAAQRTQARMNWLYGTWLQTEARSLGLPVLPATPYENLVERVLSIIA